MNKKGDNYVPRNEKARSHWEQYVDAQLDLQIAENAMGRNRRVREGSTVLEAVKDGATLQSLSAVTPALVRRWDIPCRPRMVDQKLCMEFEGDSVCQIGIHGKPLRHRRLLLLTRIGCVTVSRSLL
jgi:hypothetical protein